MLNLLANISKCYCFHVQTPIIALKINQHLFKQLAKGCNCSLKTMCAANLNHVCSFKKSNRNSTSIQKLIVSGKEITEVQDIAGTTEKARTENSAPSKMQGWKTRERKTRHQCAAVEKARTENAAPKCRGGKGEKMYI